nr:NAD-dependent epimerase/dehydratase family protein [Kineosphaera limosa]
MALLRARTVVCVALSTDLESDLRVTTVVRRGVLRELVRAAADAAQHHLVVVTSARVYGARAGNPVPLPADHPLQARDDGGIAGDLLDVEAELGAIREARPDLQVTVVRPAAVVGPGVDTSITRHFESPRLLVLGGSHPLWQFVHVEDLARAILVVVQAFAADSTAATADGPESCGAPAPDHGGVVTVGNPHPLTQERVERLTGKRRLELPAAAAHATARRLHAAGVLSTSGGDLDYVRYPWVVGSHWLESVGWSPRYDNETCLQAMLEQLRDRGLLALRRDAAVGTASAAVALVGTAAMLKRRRRKGA